MKALLLVAAILAVSQGASAQTAPSAAEVAAYDGLHRAAHMGDLDAIRSLIAAGADLNARDGNGRTPAHVPAFASNDAAVETLAAAGADMNAVEDQVYEPRRVCRRLIWVSYAAMASVSRAA